MARKVFISVLGTGLYSKCKYTQDKEGFSSSETLFVQTATLEYLNAKSWDKNDLGLFLLTEKAKEKNWDKNITQRYNFTTQQDIAYKGLEKDIDDLYVPIRINPLPILDGNDEAQIWENFTRVFKELEYGDELYFDVTHAFRFLPMLILVLCNYAKFLKKVIVKSITYGNYEARDTKVTPNEAPIINLLSLSQLQDWTYAAGQYLDCGNVKKFVELSKDKYSDFSKKLEVAVADIHTCRGINIIESNNTSELKTEMSALDTSELPPLKFIFDEIKKDFDKYEDVANVKNGYKSAYWCFKNQLYQQAITILIETIITDVCFSEELDWKRRKYRDIASSAFYICSNNIAEKGWSLFRDSKPETMYKSEYLSILLKEDKTDSDIAYVQNAHEKDMYKSKFLTELKLYRQFVSSSRLKYLLELTNMIKDVRDDMDHAGMRDGARPSSTKSQDECPQTSIEDEMKRIFTKVKELNLC